MSKPAGRRPDYSVGALDKRTNDRGTIGAAWKNQDGTISVKLNSFVKLDGLNLVITLFPEGYVPRGQRGPAKPAAVPQDLPENVVLEAVNDPPY